MRNNFSCQRLEDLIGEDFTLERADVSGKLLGHRLIGPDFQDVFAGVAGSGGVEGVTKKSGGLRRVEKEAEIFQGWEFGVFSI